MTVVVPTGEELLKVMNDIAALKDNINSLGSQFSQVKADIAALGDKIVAAEARLAKLEVPTTPPPTPAPEPVMTADNFAANGGTAGFLFTTGVIGKRATA